MKENKLTVIIFFNKEVKYTVLGITISKDHFISSGEKLYTKINPPFLEVADRETFLHQFRLDDISSISHH